MVAVGQQNVKAVEYLLNAGAHPFIKDVLNQEAINYKNNTDATATQIDGMLAKAKVTWRGPAAPKTRMSKFLK